MKGPKKLIVVPEPILEELMSIAKKSGLTISELTALILAHAARILKGRENITAVFKDTVVMHDLKRLGAVMVSSEAFISLLNGNNDEEYFKDFVEKAKSFAKTATLYLKAHGIEVEPKDIVSLFVPSAMVDSIEDDRNMKLIISFNNPGTGLEKLIEYAKDIATTVITTWGYNVRSIDSLESIVVIEFEKKRKESEEA
ncbi:hypothetical protein PYJP_03020 [Pyrofollis japonicus]|uniref:hypothetical protein n=1 Tax=Pyrofollis japonicus TaxID=3060460 RepID=UPI00295BCDEB|nr:hypothetical protein [Pyrofollis japonicus]BEP16950.1 hypothetical protein PYJP_03020 [Pyrofollis japonicus]